MQSAWLSHSAYSYKRLAKYFPVDSLLTDTDFSLHPASNALNSKIAFVKQITEETYQLQNKLSHIIRFASNADWGRRYN